jgi:hypothetical protein
MKRSPRTLDISTRTSGGLGRAFGRDGLAVLVHRAEVAPVEREVLRILAREHGIGLGARGDQDGARGKVDVRARGAALVVGELRPHRERLTAWPNSVDADLARREVLGEADAFLERLLHSS